MVSEAVIGALVGGGAAVAGSYVQAYFGRKNAKDQIEAQNRRREAELYLAHKAEALKDAFEVLHKASDTVFQQYTMVSAANNEEEIPNPLKREDLFEMADLISEYRKKMTIASIYLDEEQQEVLIEANDALFLHSVYAISKMSEEESFIFDFLNRLDLERGLDELHVDELEDLDMNAFRLKLNKAKLTLKEEMNKPIEGFEYSGE